MDEWNYILMFGIGFVLVCLGLLYWAVRQIWFLRPKSRTIYYSYLSNQEVAVIWAPDLEKAKGQAQKDRKADPSDSSTRLLVEPMFIFQRKSNWLFLLQNMCDSRLSDLDFYVPKERLLSDEEQFKKIYKRIFKRRFKITPEAEIELD